MLLKVNHRQRKAADRMHSCCIKTFKSRIRQEEKHAQFTLLALAASKQAAKITHIGH